MERVLKRKSPTRTITINDMTSVNGKPRAAAPSRKGEKKADAGQRKPGEGSPDITDPELLFKYVEALRDVKATSKNKA